MTPHSTDAAHKISPLDVFGPLMPAPSAAPQLDPAQRFDHVLQNSSSAPKNAFSIRRDVADSGRSDSAAPHDDDSRATDSHSSAIAPKKQSAKTIAKSAPTKKNDDDEVSGKRPDDQATSATIEAPPVPLPIESGLSEEANEEIVIENLELDALAAAENAAADIHAAAAAGANLQDGNAGNSETQVVVAIEEISEQPMLNVQSADDLVAVDEHKARTPEDGSLSAELAATAPVENSEGAVDPIVAIDAQTAAEEGPAKQEGDDGKNSSASDPAHDASATATPTVDVRPTAENANAAGATAMVASAPDLPKENSASQATNLTPAAPQASSRLPQHVLTRAESHRHNPAPVPVDSARFLSRVAKAFLSAHQRDGEVRLRLSPPELGSLRLQVSVQDGVMVARMETETEAARSSLVNNLPTLRERLAEQGIRVERFDIDLMQRPSTGTPDRPSDPQQQNDPQPLRLLRTRNDSPDPSIQISAPVAWNGSGRLNVII